MTQLHRSNVISLAVGLFVLVPMAATADPVGTGSFRVEGIASTGEFCVRMTMDDLPLKVFGTPVNLATSAVSLLCAGTASGGSVSGHCTSAPDNTQFVYDFHITSQANTGSGFAFVGDMTNVTGGVPTTIGGATYVFDGTASSGFLPLPAPTIAGCTLASDAYFTGVAGINAFREAAVSSGGAATVNTTASYTNPDTGQVETLAVDVGFGDVTGGGSVLVTATSSVAGQIPSTFTLDVGGYRPSFFDVSSSATTSLPITICQHYADSTPDDGLVDGTTVPEDLLTILHGEGDPLVFVDRTVSRNPIDNIICAEVDHLSPFIMAAAVPVSHDSVVLPVAPVKVTIGEHGATVTKKVRVTVRNADLAEAAGHEIQLTVSHSTCPASVLLDTLNQPVLPDFDPKTPLIGNRITVIGGRTKVATLPLRFVAGDYVSLNAKSPVRCAITLAATSLDTAPVAEINPSNNSVSVSIDVVDTSDF